MDMDTDTFVRLVKEYADLSNKCAKLIDFMATDKYASLREMQQELLKQQLSHMTSYRDILFDRITIAYKYKG